jgi:hypothetical protein
MTEFHVGLSEEEVKQLISEKLKLYTFDAEDEESPLNRIRVKKFSGVQLEHNDPLYERYAHFHSKPPGTFELYRHVATSHDIELYRFYVERPSTEETKKELEKQRKESEFFWRKFRLTEKYNKMHVKQLNKALRARGVKPEGNKNEKVRTIVSLLLKE